MRFVRNLRISGFERLVMRKDSSYFLAYVVLYWPKHEKISVLMDEAVNQMEKRQDIETTRTLYTIMDC